MTKAEFSAGLDGMKCCGSNCPFSSWCEAEAVEMGFGANLKLPFPDFANRLMATNNTGWFPHCASSVTLTLTLTLTLTRFPHCASSVTLSHSAAAPTTKTISQVSGRP